MVLVSAVQMTKRGELVDEVLILHIAVCWTWCAGVMLHAIIVT